MISDNITVSNQPGNDLNPGSTTVTVTTSTGDTKTVSPGTNTRITDSEGNVVTISKGGAVIKGKQDKNAFGAGATNSTVAQAAADDKLPKVTLTLDTSKPYFGHDTSSNGGPWVSIQTGKSVAVIAGIELQKSQVKVEDIRYRTNDGMVVAATGSNPATLEVYGRYGSTPVPIVAVADTGKVDSLKKSFILGKINTVGYDVDRRRVWLVPVNGATAGKDEVAKELNRIYRQGVVEWDVQCDPSKVSLSLSGSEVSALCAGFDADLMSSYTDAMKVALQKFGKEPDERTYLIFLVPGKGASGVTGFMPLNRSAGFIYTQNLTGQPLARAIAHELGHGAFGLEHVGFAKDKAAAPTDNLMDYSGGTALTKAQWDAMHSEYRRITWFQGADEGKAFGDKGTEFICLKDKSDLDVLAKYSYYYLPDGRVIDLKDIQPSGFYSPNDKTPNAPGSLFAIRFGDYDFSHLFYKNKRESAGYGYSVGEKAYINFLPVSSRLVAGKEKEAVRVYIDAATKQLRIERDSKVVDTITLKGECGCTFPPVEKGRFAIDASGYEKAYTDNATVLNNALYDDSKLVEQLAEKVKSENEKSGERRSAKVVSTVAKDDARQAFFGELLVDKMEAYELLNDCSFIVVAMPVSTLSTSELSWNTLARKVFEKAGLPSNAVLVALPYVTSPGILSSYSGTSYFMPGLAYGNDVQLSKDNLGTGYSNKQKEVSLVDGAKLTSVGKYVADIFTNLSKRHIVKTAYITYKGDILYQDADRGSESGYFGSYEFRISQDKRFDGYCNLLAKISNTQKSQGAKLGEINDLALPVYEKELSVFLKNNSTGEEQVFGHGLNELFGSSRDSVCREYAKWYRDRKYADKSFFEKATSPESFCFYGGKNEVVYQDNLSRLDALGLILSPVGFDWLTDGIGFFYAGYYGDAKNQSLYGASILMPIVPGAALHVSSNTLLKGLATGESEVVLEGGEYLVRAVGKQADDAFAFLSKLDKTWTPELKGSLTSEIGDILTSCADDAARMNVAEAWKILNKTSSKARLDAKAITNLSDLLKKNNFGWTSEEFSRVFKRFADDIPSGKTISGMDELVEAAGENIEWVVGTKLSESELLAALKNLDSFNPDGAAKLATELCCETTWKTVGAEMVLRTVEKGNHWKRVTGFEIYHNGIGGGRYIDIELDKVIRVEVKSWKKMYPPTFIKQFVEKDLANVSSLDELKWVFDAKYDGDLKADILKVLKSEKGKAALNKLPDSKKELFFSYDKTIGITDKNIERLINSNFSKIIEIY